MDAVLRSAFEAGVRAGCGYQVISAVPEGHINARFERWKRDWQGDPAVPAVCADPRNEISDRFVPR